MNGMPLRYWRTGALAVVMAALGPVSGAAQRGAVEGRTFACRQSPFDVADTALHIEDAARRHGMAVFARSLRGAAARVIVLESAQGGTPVLMHQETGNGLELPLSVIVRRATDGRVEVLSGVVEHWQAMPHALAQDLAELDAVVGDALRAGPSQARLYPRGGSLAVPGERGVVTLNPA